MKGVVMVGKLPYQRWCGFLPPPGGAEGDGAGSGRVRVRLRIEMGSLKCRTTPDVSGLVRMFGHRFVAGSMGLEGLEGGRCVLVVKGEEEADEARRAVDALEEELGRVSRVEVEVEGGEEDRSGRGLGVGVGVG